MTVPKKIHLGMPAAVRAYFAKLNAEAIKKAEKKK